MADHPHKKSHPVVQPSDICADNQPREAFAPEGDETGVSLVLDEGVITTSGELLLGGQRLPIECHITVEWLRGIGEPTWYGYFTPYYDLRMLPGPYVIVIDGAEYRILLRRMPTAIPGALPFWGLGEPPPVPPVERSEPG